MMEQSKMLDINIETITKEKPYMFNLIEELDKEEYLYEGKIRDIFQDVSEKNEKIMGVRKENHDYYLNSRYDSQTGINRWLQVYKSDKEYGIAIVIGMANLAYIRAMRKEYPNVRLLVYEPDKYLWGEVLLNIDFSDVLADPMVNIVVGQIGKLYLKELMSHLVDYANYKYVQTMISPNYDKIYPAECEAVRELVYHAIEETLVDKNTMCKYNEHFCHNRCSNFYDSLWQYNAGDIKELFADIDFDKVPAILVAAGPSLDKNVEELKRAKGRAFIIAVDSSVRTLAKYDIMPDMTATIDPCKPVTYLYKDKQISKLPLLISFHAFCESADVHKGKKFYFHTEFPFINQIWDKYEKNYLKIETAGSVANDAFSFLRFIGFKHVIMIGQDLAYTGDKIHSRDTYEESFISNDVSRKKEVYVIKDIYGNDVKTDYAMDIYRRWFENQITLHKELEVIDATEGGAKIEGTEVMTLQEAIDTKCKSGEIIDFAGKINQAQRVYTKEEREEIQEYLKKVTEDMKGDIPKKLEEAKREYLKLLELNTKRKYNSKEFERLLKKVEEYNKWMTETVEVDMLSMYAARDGFDVMEGIFANHDDMYENIRTIADSGIRMVDSYKNGTKKFVESMTAIFEWFHSDEYQPVEGK